MTTSQEEIRARSRRREELRDFLRTRRARISPEDVGLPGGGRRRTPGLRREEVAVLAGVGASWYTWLEQGRDIKVSESVLDAISRTLLLDSLERDHLYRLAGLNPPQPEPREMPAAGQLAGLVDGWMPNPAYVVDRHWNVSVMNDAARVVFGFTEADGNCLVAFFTNAVYRGRHRYWEDVAPSLVAEFRRDAARFPDDPGFERIAARLSEASPEFAGYWARHEIAARSRGVKAIDHPRAGCLVFEHSVLHMPDRPDVRLMLHTPQGGGDTRQRLLELLEREARKANISLVEAG